VGSVTTVSNGDDPAARRSTYRATFLVLASTSVTFLKIFVPTAMCGVGEDALRTAQAGLAGKLHRHVARPSRQGLPARGLGRHLGLWLWASQIWEGEKSLLLPGQVCRVHCPIHCQQ
jgi:hypothetical protein